MDKNKEPGIVFDKVFVKSCKIETNTKKSQKEKKDVKIDFQINNFLNKTKTQLKTDFQIIIGKENPESPISLDVTMCGIFRIDINNKNLDLEDFSKNNAPAIIFPYIREFITSITSRAGIHPPILLPPMNILRIMKMQKQKEIL